ncbi:hypothetical protein C0991_010141 [Blastosporella zonata]|nr:hypothetical protein C0991_010141 [Blastosporella zonata]
MSPTPPPSEIDPPQNPLKRKSPPTPEHDGSTRVDLDPDEEDADGEEEERSFTPPSLSGQGGEYESGHITCEVCGMSVSFRDVETGGFSLREWNDHRESCIAPATDGAPPPAQVPPSTSPSPLLLSTSASVNPAKRRRAKRTEEERKAYLGADPYVECFEAYRVLCKSCDKWIRLRPNSTYCSIPWDAHRKSCLAKKINSKNVYALEERNALFSKDPDVRKFDAERVLCNICDNWFPLNPDNHLAAVQTWLQHRAACQNSTTASTSASAPPQPSGSPPLTSTTPKDVPPALKTEDSPILALPPPPSPKSQPHPRQAHPEPHPSHSPNTSHSPSRTLSPSFHDLNPANYAPAHESRRRNAEQRAATLRADKLIQEVEPNRVFCTSGQVFGQASTSGSQGSGSG